MDDRRLKPYHGLFLFVAVLAALIFIAVPLQYNFEIYGLALTEVMLLVMTATAFFLAKANFKQTFPLKLPPVREFFGGAFVYGGVYVLMIPPLLLIQYFFPKIIEVSENLSEFGTSVSPVLAVLIIAVMPAICEEALHRGFILACFKNSKHIKSIAAMVLINGVIFGIFHLDPYRFLPTAMLGCAFAYIALKTESMILPVIFHFINNLMSVVSMFSFKQEEFAESADLFANFKLPAIVGVGLIYAAVGAILLFIGVCMINKKAPKTVTIAILLISAIVMAVTGMIVTASSAITTVFSKSGTIELKESDNGELAYQIQLENGFYSFSVSALCQNTGIDFTLEKIIPETTEIEKENKIIFNQHGNNNLIFSQAIELGAGDYILRLKLEPAREGVYPDLILNINILRLLG